MNRVCLVVTTGLGLAFLLGRAVSQQKSLKDQLVGTWTLSSFELTRPDGSKSYLFGRSLSYSLPPQAFLRVRHSITSNLPEPQHLSPRRLGILNEWSPYSVVLWPIYVRTHVATRNRDHKS